MKRGPLYSSPFVGDLSDRKTRNVNLDADFSENCGSYVVQLIPRPTKEVRERTFSGCPLVDWIGTQLTTGMQTAVELDGVHITPTSKW